MATGGTLNRLPFVLHGVSEGLSGNAILKALIGGGMGMRRQDFYRLVGVARAYAETAPSVASLPAAGSIADVAVPRPSRMPGRFISNTFLAVQNTETGFFEPRWVTVTSQDALTRDEVELLAVDAFEGDEDSSGSHRVRGVSLVGVWLGQAAG